MLPLVRLLLEAFVMWPVLFIVTAKPDVIRLLQKAERTTGSKNLVMQLPLVMERFPGLTIASSRLADLCRLPGNDPALPPPSALLLKLSPYSLRS